MMASLKVSELQKHFESGPHRVDVLRGISFQMKGSDSLAVTGPSGSGKSTLLHCVGTLTRPSSGRIEIDAKNPFDLPEPELARFRNRRIGFVFQDPYLLPQYSLLENVLIPAMAYSSEADGAMDRAMELIRNVHLEHRLHHRPSELSGGERQRAAVARALMNRPALLLCDEPTGSLDRSTAQVVADLLFELHQAEENILIVVTHSLELAKRFPTNMELREGRCAEV
jgi:lipoprotein-releasing system ATP-binding protein